MGKVEAFFLTFGFPSCGLCGLVICKAHFRKIDHKSSYFASLFLQHSPPRHQGAQSSVPPYTPQAHPPPSVFMPAHQGGDRLSPGSLDMRLTAELNRLEYMEESVRQLTDVERTRAVSLAQQETVSLAQILKVSTSCKSSWVSPLY